MGVMKNYETAKILRKNQTTQEQKLWNLLRNRSFHNLKFKRQYPVGSYIVDFICLEKNVVIEVDGELKAFLFSEIALASPVIEF